MRTTTRRFGALTTLKRRIEMHCVFDVIAALPQKIAVPVLTAPDQWRTRGVFAQIMAEFAAVALCACGDLAPDVADMLSKTLRNASAPPTAYPAHGGSAAP